MNKTELESKHLAELHALAAEAGVERYRMLARAELIERPRRAAVAAAARRQGRERARAASPRRDPAALASGGRANARRAAARRARSVGTAQGRDTEPERELSCRPRLRRRSGTAAERPKRRRRRRFGRRARRTSASRIVLLPAAPGRQALVYAESRERLHRAAARARRRALRRGAAPIRSPC